MIKAFAIIAFIMLGGVGVLLTDRSQKRRAERHMEGREPLSPKEFAKKYFSGAEVEVAEKLLPVLARHLRIDLSKLSPEDQLVEDLRMDALDSLSTEEFIIDIEEEFDVNIPDKDAQRMFTYREVVAYLVCATGSFSSVGDEKNTTP